MPSQLESCIGFLEETTDAKTAYFSFTTDDTGEHGVIKANKDGLRLYALELLRKSVEMEAKPESADVMFFEEFEWIVDDAGYNLIWGVQPTVASREQLKAEDEAFQYAPNNSDESKKINSISGWLPSLIILSGGVIIATIAALKWFH
jgi:hypothetical protein